MRAVVEAILVLTVVVLCMKVAALQQELAKWKRDCYHYGYTLVDTDVDGNIEGMRLKSPVELGLEPKPSGVRRHFVELYPEDKEPSDDHKNGQR